MKLVNLVFHEINTVIVHAGVPVHAISLDRVRMARPSGNIQVNSSPMMLAVIYPDERIAVQFDQQRVTTTDSQSRPPEASPVVDVALSQYAAIGNPSALAFGFNIRIEFDIENVQWPGALLAKGVIRDPQALADVLRTDAFQSGLSLVYRRGLKIWTLRVDPVVGNPHRIIAHSNIHEDLKPPNAPQPSEGPPPPPWLSEGEGTDAGASLPGLEAMKGDLSLQTRTTLETVAGLFALGGSMV